MRGRFFAGRPAFFVPKPESVGRRVRVWRVSYVFPKNKYHKYHKRPQHICRQALPVASGPTCGGRGPALRQHSARLAEGWHVATLGRNDPSGQIRCPLPPGGLSSNGQVGWSSPPREGLVVGCTERSRLFFPCTFPFVRSSSLKEEEQTHKNMCAASEGGGVAQQSPKGGLTLVLRSVEATRGRAANRMNGWYGMPRRMRAFWYAAASSALVACLARYLVRLRRNFCFLSKVP